MKKAIVICLLIAAVAGIALAFGGAQGADAGAPSSYLRVHIRANSNDEADQAVKYRVRDGVVEFLTPTVAECETKQEAIAAVSAKLDEIERVAERILEENGYGADVVHDGATGLAWAESGMYDVIILDVMLPKMDGFAVVADLRRENVSTPVLLLTARDAVPDKITGLDSGADDYMTKPFSPAELLAHLRALTRRQGEVLFEKLAAGDLELNLESHDLSRGGKSIHLSYKEYCLAKVLMTNAGQVVSKDLIIAKVWGIESSAEDNNVEAYVSFLRKKMKFLGSTARIETLRKAGYRFAAGAEESVPC